jgi:hypothetical protein
MSHDRESAKKAILSARKTSFEKATDELSEISSQFTVGAGVSAVGSCKTVSNLLSDIVFGGENSKVSSLKRIFDEKPPQISINSLWKYGISGDFPIITFDVGNFFFALPLEKRIRAFRLLTMKNVRCDLVILYSETDRYNRKTEKKLLSLIASCSASGYLSRNKGGIHLIEKTCLSDDIYALKFRSHSYTELFAEKTPEKKRLILQNSTLPVDSANSPALAL